MALYGDKGNPVPHDNLEEALLEKGAELLCDVVERVGDLKVLTKLNDKGSVQYGQMMFYVQGHPNPISLYIGVAYMNQANVYLDKGETEE